MTELVSLGLRPNETVRFRRRPSERWSKGRAGGVESDGSLRIIDEKGATLSLAIEHVQVRRGRSSWEPAKERAARTEQLGLL